MPKLPPKEAKRRGEAKFADDFLEERGRAVHGYLSQMLALQSQSQTERDRERETDTGFGGEASKDELASGLTAALIGHALRPLLC